MRYRVLPYKQGSRSAKALAEALGGKVLRLEGSTFKPKADDIIINWGGKKVPDNAGDYDLAGVAPLNPPTPIAGASNKLTFFTNMAAAGLADCLPPFWMKKEDISSEAFPVVCRTVLSGHSGAGIVIARDASELVEAQLYTGYMKKKDEYRVHCGSKTSYEPDGPCKGTVVISLQRKARRLDCETPDWEVRNHANGFVYVRDQINPPSCVLEVARQAFEASGLDFGAVDVIYNEKKDRAYVLEINTAPGLEGQTVEDYATYFKGLS